MSKGLVSVCMPTYNRAEYLAEAIDSVLNQSYGNFELIVVDDGSTDSTQTLMEYYTGQDKRIKYFKQENQGIAAARNTACHVSQGEYIAVMDSDDLMSPDRLKNEVKALEKTRKDIVYSSFLQADEHAKVFGVVEAPKGVTPENIMDNTSAPHVTILGRRECFMHCPYREAFKVNDDKALLWDFYRAGYSFTRIKEPLMIVRYHSGSTSTTQDKGVQGFSKIIDEEIKAAS